MRSLINQVKTFHGAGTIWNDLDEIKAKLAEVEGRIERTLPNIDERRRRILLADQVRVKKAIAALDDEWKPVDLAND